MRVRLRFSSNSDSRLPDIRLGGQLAFPLVSKDRRPPKVFWETFKASDAFRQSEAAMITGLLKSLRDFLLDPASYLGYTGSESPEARRLQTWCRDVARLNGQRLDVIRKYETMLRHAELFDPVAPLKKEWFHEKLAERIEKKALLYTYLYIYFLLYTLISDGLR